MPGPPSPVVLVHGAWHGPWCWDRVLPLLEARGIEAHAASLPTCDPGAARETTLHDDAAALRAVLDRLERPAVVLGHSYGGVVITEGAAGHPMTEHLVYLAAFMPDEGENTSTLSSQSEPNPNMFGAIELVEGGRLRLNPERVGPALYNDCDEETVAWARANVRSMRGGFVEAPDAIAWRSKPSTYVVCSADRVILPPLQRRMAARAGRVFEWDTSHSPFASRPELVADLLVSLARD